MYSLHPRSCPWDKPIGKRYEDTNFNGEPMNTIIGLLLASLLFLSYLNPVNAKQFFDDETELVTKGPFYKGEYRLGLYQDSTLDLDKKTHLIVIGSGVKEDSDQFFQSGMARARRYKELNSENQVIIMGSPEVIDRDDEKVFSDFNINVYKVEKQTFTADKFLSEIALFTKIASLDFYGHSSPWALKLGKTDAALDPGSYKNKLTSLKNNFLPDAYITLNGCNAGYSIAPLMSQYLELPVAGALTGSLFERIESDGQWYKESDRNPDNYVLKNDFSYTESLSCKLGYCWRMKPSRHSYYGYWGQFVEGLSFYKYFCNFNNPEKCMKNMAKSLLSFPSVTALSSKPSKAEFEKVVFDWLCSTGKDRQYFNRCVDGIKNALQNKTNYFVSHSKPELNCNFQTCNAKVVCKSKKLFGNGPKGGSCKLEADLTGNGETTVKEYKAFMQGFELLNQ